MPRERKGKVIKEIVTNTDEPKVGDFAFTVYDNTHPINGSSEVDRFRKEMKGLRGKTITLRVKGFRVGDDEKAKRFNRTRTFTVHRYNDIFGPGGAYLSIIKEVKDQNSDDTLVATSIQVEEPSEDDELWED